MNRRELNAVVPNRATTVSQCADSGAARRRALEPTGECQYVGDCVVVWSSAALHSPLVYGSESRRQKAACRCVVSAVRV